MSDQVVAVTIIHWYDDTAILSTIDQTKAKKSSTPRTYETETTTVSIGGTSAEVKVSHQVQHQLCKLKNPTYML